VTQAIVVYDRNYLTDERNGPQEHGRIGVAIGSDIFWTGRYWFPGTDNGSYNARVHFAEEIARRWNAGDQ
jgi:hypothetical protein